ncbi:MAG: hypothetical protein IT490_13760 [Candidatus Contendobacter sp.]|nr:hypothetical protein [Candidatus Contendobacter sp.]
MPSSPAGPTATGNAGPGPGRQGVSPSATTRYQGKPVAVPSAGAGRY